MNFKDWLRTSKTLYLSSTVNQFTGMVINDSIVVQPEGKPYGYHLCNYAGRYNINSAFLYKRTFIVFKTFSFTNVFIVRNLRQHHIRKPWHMVLHTDVIRRIS